MIIDITVIIFLTGIGIALILLEIFLLPGITVAGIGGAVFAAGGIIYAYTVDPSAGHATLIVSVAVFGGAFAWLLRSGSFRKVSLHTNIDARLTSARELDIHPGDEGITLSRLAPIGKARIRDIVVEAKSTGEFIDEQIPVRVVRVDGYNVLVVQTDNTIHSQKL
ncbi:MAG: NfeD family protein [Tannerellaceae bacterium]|jgi:membrane-bound ClpP family serine protease|nr:NfeD family protein [Tannerellaceae bacterium]